jgi:hypothetical protein
MEEMLLELEPICQSLYHYYEKYVALLKDIAFGRLKRPHDEENGIILRLKRRGILDQRDNTVVIMSGVFEEYIRRQAHKRQIDGLSKSELAEINQRKFTHFVEGDDVDNRQFSYTPPDGLSPSEEQLFSLLSNEPSRVFEKGEIRETIWGPNKKVPDSHIAVLVQRLREKLEENSGQFAIVTHRGKGYRLVIDASKSGDVI